MKDFCQAKDTVTKTKLQAIEWEKNNLISDRRPISKIYKELKNKDLKSTDTFS